MFRIPEPNEVMDDPEQVLAYAAADFMESNLLFLDLLEKISSKNISGLALDIGCGPAKIPILLLKKYSKLKIHALDASREMLNIAIDNAREDQDIQNRLAFIHGMLPHQILPSSEYKIFLSNSVLHHLSDPHHLWVLIKEITKKGAKILVMDLNRPKSKKEAKCLVNLHAKNEANVLKEDFFNSLCASYTIEEIKEQLDKAQLNGLKIEMVSERHWAVFGSII